MIRFPCPRCAAALRAPDRAGQKVTCPKCDRVVPVPDADDIPTAELDDESPRRKFPTWAWGAIAAGVLVLVVLVVIVANRGNRGQSDPAPVDDVQAIVGRWELVSGVVMQDGARSEYPDPRRSQEPKYFRFDRDKLETNKGDTAAFVLDPAKSPKWITATFDDGRPEQRFVDGIYELKGDELRVCWAPRAKQARPTSFTDLGRNGVVMVFRRAR